MQVSDLVGHYNNSTQQKEGLTGTKGVKRLVSSLREMSAGNIFEGTVNSMKNGQVVLGLSNGQVLTARLDGKVPITVGQSMFFQVKSNDGTQIAIRPFTVAGNRVNLTLMDALKAAGLAVDAKNLSMVNTMMEEQMSIDRNSLAQMARLVQNNPGVDVRTLVQMQKLDIPIIPEFVSQFENYMDDQQAIGKALSDFMLELPLALSNEELSAGDLRQMSGQLLAIITEGLPEELAKGGQSEAASAAGLSGNGEAEILIPGQEANVTESGQNAAAVPTAGEGEALQESVPLPEMPEKAAEQAASAETAADSSAVPEETVSASGSAETLRLSPEEQPMQGTPHTLGGLLTGEELTHLTSQLTAVLKEPEQSFWFTGNLLDQDQSTVSVLNALQRQIADGAVTDKKALLDLFSGKEFQTLIRDALEQQWMLRPEELGGGDQISKLYEKLESQLSRMEAVVKAAGQASQNITQLAADIRNNVEFMNQINQNYTYVQIPLKMSGQSASGELYVYTNKKNLAEGKEDLTAFLHLDMDHLGSTDVSVRLHGKDISTQFYFDSDESYGLVQAHLPELEERLAAKGYRCNLSAVNESKKVNFVEDFLKKDQPSAGMVHRYSFDMKA